MQIEELSLPGLKLVRPHVYFDDRGFFLESFRRENYEKYFPAFVQDNHSFSSKDVLRGMHFQRGQAKLIYVVEGIIFDVAVDIRRESKTYGKWQGVMLDAKKPTQFFIPDGYAHGFCVLTPSAHVTYKVSEYYNHKEEKGFRWDDPAVAIKWPTNKLLLSNRDKNAPLLREVSL